MKHVLKSQAVERKNSDACSILQHGIDDAHLNLAIVTLAGRYPDAKCVVNERCKELVYVQLGSGEVSVNGKVYALNAGDMVLIEAGEKYYWQGTMQLLVSCSPAWSADQHHVVD